MDDMVNRFARELVDTVVDAVARDPAVAACRERARAAGYELHVTLEARIAVTPVPPPAGAVVPELPAESVESRPFEISASDRRFLRSLRIAADPLPEEVE